MIGYVTSDATCARVIIIACTSLEPRSIEGGLRDLSDADGINSVLKNQS